MIVEVSEFLYLLYDFVNAFLGEVKICGSFTQKIFKRAKRKYVVSGLQQLFHTYLIRFIVMSFKGCLSKEACDLSLHIRAEHILCDVSNCMLTALSLQK
jgi:hypothetical protein